MRIGTLFIFLIWVSYNHQIHFRTQKVQNGDVRHINVKFHDQRCFVNKCNAVQKILTACHRMSSTFSGSDDFQVQQYSYCRTVLTKRYVSHRDINAYIYRRAKTAQISASISIQSRREIFLNQPQNHREQDTRRRYSLL